VIAKEQSTLGHLSVSESACHSLIIAIRPHAMKLVLVVLLALLAYALAQYDIL